MTAGTYRLCITFPDKCINALISTKGVRRLFQSLYSETWVCFQCVLFLLHLAGHVMQNTMMREKKAEKNHTVWWIIHLPFCSPQERKKRPHLTSASALLYFTGVDLVHCMATVNESHCKVILSDIIGPTVKQFSPDESLSIFQDDSSCTHSGHWMDWWVWKQWKPARTS